MASLYNLSFLFAAVSVGYLGTPGTDGTSSLVHYIHNYMITIITNLIHTLSVLA